MIRDITNKIRNFLKETYLELKKVIWPDQKYVVAATLIIFVIVILVGLFLLVTDYTFAKVFTYLMQTFPKGVR